MKNTRFKVILHLTLLVAISSVWAQETPLNPAKNVVSKYDYHDAFAPFFYTKNGTNTRSASGQPGAEYWQNRADYQIAVSLNESTNEISGSETLTYTNNSPDNLGFLWMYLDQNLFSKDSRGNAVVPLTGSRNGAQGQVFDGGNKIKSVKIISLVKGKNVEVEAKYSITDTRMKIILPEVLKSNGGFVKLKIDFSFEPRLLVALFRLG